MVYREREQNSPLGAASIWADNDTVGDIEVLTDILEHAGLGVQVVDGDVEEALDLAGVQVHGDDVVAASGLEHVRHQLGGDRSTTLVLLILAGVREVGDDGCDAAGRGGLASVDHDKELHESIVDIIGFRRLENEDCNKS